MVFTSFSQYPKIYTNSTTQHQMRIIFLRPSQALQIPRFWSLLAFARDARGCSRDAHLCQISAVVQAKRVFYRKDQIAFNRVFESLHITSRRYSKVTFSPGPEFQRSRLDETHVFQNPCISCRRERCGRVRTLSMMFRRETIEGVLGTLEGWEGPLPLVLDKMILAFHHRHVPLSF